MGFIWLINTRINRQILRANSKVKDKTRMRECQEEKSKLTEDIGEDKYGGIRYIDT